MSIEIGMTGTVVQRETRYVTVDGNDAAATVAHRLSEVIAIYRSPPGSPADRSASGPPAANGRRRVDAGVSGALGPGSGGVRGPAEGSLSCREAVGVGPLAMP